MKVISTNEQALYDCSHHLQEDLKKEYYRLKSTFNNNYSEVKFANDVLNAVERLFVSIAVEVEDTATPPFYKLLESYAEKAVNNSGCLCGQFIVYSLLQGFLHDFSKDCDNERIVYLKQQFINLDAVSIGLYLEKNILISPYPELQEYMESDK